MVSLSLAITDVVLGAGFMVAAVMLARTANSARRGYFAVALAILSGIVAAVVWYRYTYGEVYSILGLIGFVFGPAVVGMFTVTLLARPHVKLAATAGLTVLSTFAMYAVVFFLAIAAMPLAGALTAAAGNPPVNSADSDTVISIYAAVAGVVCGCLMSILGRTPPPTDNQGHGP